MSDRDEGVETKEYSRRTFLKLAGVTGAALGLAGGLGGVLAACGGDEETTTTAAGETTTTSAGETTTTAEEVTTTTTAAAQTTTTAAEQTTTTTQATGGSGGLTVGVTEGPYYISNTAELTDGNLNYAGLPGNAVKISGYVYGGVGNSTPLVGAKIEIWHADSGGTYHPNTNGDAGDFDPSELALRGHVLTDSRGRYEFTSIYPGIYPGRCRHYHVRASATSYGGVVSQLIVPAIQGDSQTPQTDSIAQSLPDANDLIFTTNNGVLEATFDFHLAGD